MQKHEQLTVFYKVFNEADFLRESLQSVYDYADKIVVFEYCLESMHRIIRPDRVTKRGLSVDGTTEIIKDFPDPDKKIVYCPAGFIYGAETIPYQMIVDTAEVGEYVWVVDGDIVYPDLLCKKIRTLVDTGDLENIWVPERVFYHDMFTEKTDWLLFHQRVFRNPPRAFYFPRCFEVHWMAREKEIRAFCRDDEYVLNYSDLEDKTLRGYTCDVEAGEVASHYAYVRGVQRTLEKLLWQYEMIDRRWDSPEREACFTHARDPLEFKLKTHDFFLAHEPEHRAKWHGGQPAVMNGNKWMDYRWDDKPISITYDEARQLVGEVGKC